MASSSSSRAKGMFVSGLKWAAAIGFLGLLGLIVAVAVAMTQLPDYEQLSKRSDLGQMVRVRASDGTLLVSLGPSFGRWLSYDEIPPTMRAAMIAVEDKRFRSHVGVDPIGHQAYLPYSSAAAPAGCATCATNFASGGVGVYSTQ